MTGRMMYRGNIVFRAPKIDPNRNWSLSRHLQIEFASYFLIWVATNENPLVQVLGEVHAMTGRMTYRGKVMNRAARIASTASTGQVKRLLVLLYLPLLLLCFVILIGLC
jgi:hypothetical protein